MKIVAISQRVEAATAGAHVCGNMKYCLEETIHRDGVVFSRYYSSKYITGEPGAGEPHTGF